MEVYSLTGKSGTGKSYHAIDVCQQYGIQAILDDGLFICGGNVEAGISAKREPTKVGAIKTALFIKEDHFRSVYKRIRELKPESILILGTSDEMAVRIAARLGLPDITHAIHIEDVTTQEERKIAGTQRKQQGKHIIPVPAPQIKRNFSGYFLDPMKLIREWTGLGERETVAERTVVRPTYSYMGNFTISDQVFYDIAQCICRSMEDIQITRVYENTSPDNLILKVMMDLPVEGLIWPKVEAFQEAFVQAVETMTAYHVSAVNVEVREVLETM